MQQTEHYQLNQWELEDRVLMADFNSDNQKTDAALHGLAEETAGKADSGTVNTLAAEVAQKAEQSALAAEQAARENADNAEKAAREAADTALGAAHSADVSALRSENCWVKLKAVTTGAVNSVSISVADVDWSQYRKVEIELSIQTNQGQTLEMQINNRSDSIYHQSGYSGNRSYLTVCRGTGKAYSQITLVPIKPSNVLYGSDQYNSGSITRESFYVQDFTLNQLTSIQFFLDSNDTFVAGSEIAIYGLKK